MHDVPPSDEESSVTGSKHQLKTKKRGRTLAIVRVVVDVCLSLLTRIDDEGGRVARLKLNLTQQYILTFKFSTTPILFELREEKNKINQKKYVHMYIRVRC